MFPYQTLSFPRKSRRLYIHKAQIRVRLHCTILKERVFLLLLFSINVKEQVSKLLYENLQKRQKADVFKKKKDKKLMTTATTTKIIRNKKGRHISIVVDCFQELK